MDFYAQEFARRFEIAPEAHSTDLKHARAMLDRYGWPVLQDFLRLYLDDDDAYLVQAGHPLGLLRRRIAKYAEAVNPRTAAKARVETRKTAGNVEAAERFLEGLARKERTT